MALATKITAFDAVFPAITYTVPTPQATPEIGSITSPGQSFGGFRGASSIVDEALRISRAWSSVTTDLQACHRNGSEPSRLFGSALDVLLMREHERQLLQDWHLNEVNRHFVNTEPLFQDLVERLSAWQSNEHHKDSVTDLLDKLTTAVRHCTLRSWHIKSSWTGLPQTMLHTLQYAAYERWTSLVDSLTFKAQLQQALASAMHHCMEDSSHMLSKDNCWKTEQCFCRFDLDKLPLASLDSAGLGGDIARRALATAVSKFLFTSIVHKRCFQVDWRGRTSCVDRLSNWVRNIFAPTIESAIRKVTHDNSIFTDAQICIFIDTAITSLGCERTSALFEHIRVWPHSEGAVDDIKAFLALNRTADKAAVCTTCEEQLQRRLLHAGTSTAEILGMYVNLINVFKRLDARGVLLEKVSPVIRSYLRSRNDAVNVLAESLFADTSIIADDEQSTLCLAITRELQNVVQDYAVGPHSLNWDDMNWRPDPIDAATTHKSRIDDVLACVLSLFDQDELVKEFDAVLADRLLSTQDPEISQETRLLELLKTRLDVTKLQNAEIMLKDIRDSMQFEKRLRSQTTDVPTPQELQRAIPTGGIPFSELYTRFESRIRRSQFQTMIDLVATRRGDRVYIKRGRLREDVVQHLKTTKPQIHQQYRILSSVSWPQASSAKSTVPQEVWKTLHDAADAFDEFSGQRRLQWRHDLSKVSIELELEDRTIIENDIPASRGALIEAFGEKSPLSTEELNEKLDQMSDALLQDALSFWIGKRVLYQQSPGTYAVLERLDMEVEVDQAEIDTAPVISTEDSLLRESAPMFEAFIANMLSNGGPKEIGGMMGITNMLKMVLPTFTYGDDEVKWLLNQMKGKGMVQEDGDLWVASQ